jgi:hypothetical protein
MQFGRSSEKLNRQIEQLELASTDLVLVCGYTFPYFLVILTGTQSIRNIQID